MISKNQCGGTSLELAPGDTIEPLDTPEDLGMAFQVYEDLRGAKRSLSEDKLYESAIGYLTRFFELAPMIVASCPQQTV